ncbi:MAG: lytic transglycosylase domain-containing protein [Thermodesulfobacteriota bacterium]
MDLKEPPIRTGHPPHPIYRKPIWRRPFQIFLKLFLFLLMFTLSFHLSSFSPKFYDRERAIEEIIKVLDKHPTELAEVTKKELAEVIYEEAIRYQHDPKFILALIAIESSFQNWAVSEQGAKGLMQVMPYVAQSIANELGIEWSGDRTLFNPYLNIKIGIYYLSTLILDFKDWRIALTAYNYGPTYVRDLLERKKCIPTNFFKSVINVYHTL